MKKNLVLREARLKRRNKIWAILRFAVIYDDLVNCEDFYEFRRTVTAYNEARMNLANSQPNKALFETAFRFFHMEHYLNKCDYPFSEEERYFLLHWDSIKLDHLKIVSNISKVYKEYWDSVIMSYKRQSSRQNRISYLVEKLDEYAEWPEFKSIDGAVVQIQSLREHYAKMLL